MKAILVTLFFVAVIASIIAYAIKTVYDLMNDIDDKQNNNRHDIQK